MAENSYTPEQIQAMNAFMDSVNASTRAMGPKADADREAAEATNTAKQNLKDFGKQIGRSAVDITKQMVVGGEGTGKFAGAVSSASEAAGDLAQKFGPLGFVVGGLIKIFGAVAAASLKQNDTIMKAYRDLSEAGSVSGSLEKLRDDLGKVGLTSDEVEKFGMMLKKNTPDIAAFGGSVTAGKDKLIGVIQGMIGPDNQIERAMSRIGYGAEEMRDATADYIAKQSRLGLSQAKTEEQLRNESVKYMTTLRELQELTGMSRDEAQKLMDQQQNEYRYAEYIRQLEMSGKKDEADNIRKYMASYEKTFGKQNATDLMEQIVNKGQAVGEASQRAMLSTQNKGYENAMKAQKGQIEMYDGLKDTAGGMRKNMNQLGEAYNTQGQQISSLTGSNEGLIGMQMMEGKTREEIMARLKADQEKSGDRLDQNTRMEQQQRAMRVAADKAMWDVGSATVSIFEKINRVVFAFGKGLATIIDFITAIVPGIKKTNYAASFRSNDDVQTDKAGAMKEKESLLAEKARLEKELTTNTVDKATLAKQIQASQTEITQLQKDAKGLKGDEYSKAQMQIAEKQRALREQEQLARDIGNGSKESAVLERKRKLVEIEERLQAEDKRLQELEKENLQTGGSSTGGQSSGQSSGGTGTGTGVTGTGGGKTMGEGIRTTVPKADGKSEVREGGTKSWRNNNPGNIRAGDFAMSHGAVGQAGGMAVFPDEATGEKARTDLLFGAGSKYKDLSLRDAIYRYAPPSENNSEAYLSQILKATGANQNTRMADLDTKQREALLAQMKQHEGWKEGKVHQARTGGVFDGPKSGYPVMLHGKEAVVPMPNMKNFMEDVKKESLSAFDNKTQNTAPAALEMPKIDFSNMEKIMSETLVGKFEDMIKQLESANDTLHDILKHAKA